MIKIKPTKDSIVCPGCDSCMYYVDQGDMVVCFDCGNRFIQPREDGINNEGIVRMES